MLFRSVGKKEGEETIANMKKMTEVFSNKVNIRMFTSEAEFGQHTEKYWRHEFGIFYDWILTN